MKQLLSIFAILFVYNISKAIPFENVYPFDVKISGEGKQSIIFIPGFACSGEVWKETVIRYEKNFTCYTFTMAGFAGIKPQAGASFKEWEKGIADYIRQHQIIKPILMGHSMGGGLALAISADYPDLISKIVVVDALPCLHALADPSFKSVQTPDCTAAISQMAALSDEQFYEMQKKTIPMLLADTSKQSMVVGWSVKSDRKTFAEMYCDFSNTDLREKIKTNTCAALILLESYFANMKHANLQYADKGLHFIMYDDPDWYFKQIDDFLMRK